MTPARSPDHRAGNPTRLRLGDSNIVNGNPRLAYSIIIEVWDDKRGTYVPVNQTNTYTLPPSDRSPNGICRRADSSYPIGTRA